MTITKIEGRKTIPFAEIPALSYFLIADDSNVIVYVKMKDPSQLANCFFMDRDGKRLIEGHLARQTLCFPVVLDKLEIRT